MNEFYPFKCKLCKMKDGSTWGISLSEYIISTPRNPECSKLFQCYELVNNSISDWTVLLRNILTLSIVISLKKEKRELFFFFYSYYFYLFIYLFIYLFLAVLGLRFARGLSLATASGGHSSSRCGDRSSSRCAGLSLSRPLPPRGTGSRRAGSVIVAHGPSWSAACGIFPDQGSNPRPLH